MADGNWRIDYDVEYTTFVNHEFGNSLERVYNDNEYLLYRYTDLKAISNDYLTIYKAIRSGTEPTDLTDYKSLKFEAKGSGKVEIKLTKASINDWNAQYKFTVEL